MEKLNLGLAKQISQVLCEVAADKELQEMAFEVCDSMYNETFVGFESEFSGLDLLEGRDYKDPEIQYLLEERARYDLDLEMAAVAAAQSGLTIEEEYFKIIDARNKEANKAAHLSNDYDDSKFDYYEEDSLLDWMDDQELQNVYANVQMSTYVVLVNYKGEPIGEALKESVPHLRTFYGKYDYS